MTARAGAYAMAACPASTQTCSSSQHETHSPKSGDQSMFQKRVCFGPRMITANKNPDGLHISPQNLVLRAQKTPHRHTMTTRYWIITSSWHNSRDYRGKSRRLFCWAYAMEKAGPT